MIGKRLLTGGVKAGKAISGSSGARKAGMGLLTAGAIGAGVVSGAGQVMDSAFDVAFDDPQADRAFVGSDIGLGTLIGSSIGGPVGSASRAHLYGNANQIAGGYMTTAGGVGVMAAGAGITGASYGFRKVMQRLPHAGVSSVGIKGMLAGAGIAAVGAGISAAGIGGARAGYQEESVRQNPFVNTTASTMNRLNISGDIVLGAHNGRRGY